MDKWEGEEGYVNRFRRTPFNGTGDLEWFGDFVSDIRRAGWELGYLKAGREEKAEDQGDSEDSEVYNLIQEMSL